MFPILKVGQYIYRGVCPPPPPLFGGPLNFTKGKETQFQHVLVVNSYPDPPPPPLSKSGVRP